MQCIVLGTRPDIIKLSPIIKEYEKRHLPYFIIHTGQHYSPEMSANIWGELELPRPKYNLQVTNVPDMITGISSVLNHEKPRSVMVLGDTKSALAGALATNRQTRINGNTNPTLHKIPLIHIEAGLRCFDIEMAEEVNRMIIDHLSTILFAPTDIAKINLINENVGGKIFVVGNTIVDAISFWVAVSGHILPAHVLVTIHRAENVDDECRLRKIVVALEEISKNIRISFPVHPRTEKKLKEFGIDCDFLVPPFPYSHMQLLLREARCVITDSGGLQEEACIVGTPCVTVRDTTERPETIACGANQVVGIESVDIVKGVTFALNNKSIWSHPYGSHVAERIVDKCQELLG